MKLEFKFSNMEQLKQVYDPVVVEKAARETVKQLQAKASTQISTAVRARYSVAAKDIKSALKPRYSIDQEGVPTGYLIYTSQRISLRHFASKGRPKVKSSRGTRYGARVKVVKSRGSHVVKGGFIGTGKKSGVEQVFKRMNPWTPYPRAQGLGPNKLKKLTGPSVSHMVRGNAPIKALNDLVQKEGDVKFANNLEHFMQKQIGLR